MNIEQLEKSASLHPTSSTAVPVGKKKKPNNRKNKKKRKAAEGVEGTEAAQAASAAETGVSARSPSNMIVEDLTDSIDPFYNQLKEIEDAKRGSQDTPNLRGGHAGVAKAVGCHCVCLSDTG